MKYYVEYFTTKWVRTNWVFEFLEDSQDYADDVLIDGSDPIRVVDETGFVWYKASLEIKREYFQNEPHEQ